MKHYDIKTVPTNGYLILPLSMTRLSGGLSPENLYEFFEFFEPKVTTKSVDVIMLYTNDLYHNTEESALSVRRKVLNQMLNHKAIFESLVVKGKRFIHGAFHFIPWDYALLNAPNFNSEKARLMAHFKNDPQFVAALQQDLDIAKREPTEANMSFLIEELVVAHLLTEKEVTLPRRMATEDGWRLLCYPGNPPVSLVYLYQKNLLGNRVDMKKPDLLFARSFYNMEEHTMIDLSKAEIDCLAER